MNPLFITEFILLGLLSTWMTATAIYVLSSKRRHDEDMQNLFEQVLGAVRSGDLPRALLFLEGEDGPMAYVLHAIIYEATKFTPKLRVAYKISLEALRRRGQVDLNPLKYTAVIAPLIGILGLIVPFVTNLSGGVQSWVPFILIFILALVIGGISQIFLTLGAGYYRETIDASEAYGRKMLTFFLGPESPINEMRSKRFPME